MRTALFTAVAACCYGALGAAAAGSPPESTTPPRETAATATAPADIWAGFGISDAYDYAKCPECGKKNVVSAANCSRCGYVFPQPSPDMTDPAYVFVPGRGYYPKGALLEPAEKRTGLITAGHILIGAGASLILGGVFANDPMALRYYGVTGSAVAVIGAPFLIVGYATRKEAVYARNAETVYENGPPRGFARRLPPRAEPTLRLEISALVF